MKRAEISDQIAAAAASMGNGPLTEAAVVRHIRPLFSRVLAHPDIYLANHSLGRPLDQTGDDLAEAFHLWQGRLDDAWEGWLGERDDFRARLARLLGAARPDCVVPKTSAGQGLRTVLNALPGKPRVLATTGEFDSVDVILKQYVRCGRAEVHWQEADARQEFHVERLIERLDAGVDLVVISQVMFSTGQVVEDLARLADACHAGGARLLVDAYHSVGVLPVCVETMGADFVIGGSYKYLRGGPGAGYLYLSPQALESGMQPLDTGWFAKQDPFSYERPDPPLFPAGGDAFLESTPPVFTWYQARAGQQFVLAIGMERLRAYTLDRLQRLQAQLRREGIDAQGADERHGAFLTIHDPRAGGWPQQLAQHGIRADARGPWLRVSSDCLTLEEEMVRAARTIAKICRGT